MSATGGLCVNHHRLNVKYGTPIGKSLSLARWIKQPYEERFWSLVRKGDGCWNWQGSKDKDGYGVFKSWVGDTPYTRAHRYSYHLHHGMIPLGLQILHRCDNPTCIRPDHLHAGSALQNMRDKVAKGRANAPFGESHSKAALTEEQAKAILNDPRPHSQIAAEYNIHVQTVSSLKTRVSWPHLGKIKGVKAERISPRRGKSSKGVTEEIVRIIRTSDERGVDLAARFGLKPQDISDIRHRRSWAHIE
jgi:hypothetical protein